MQEDEVPIQLSFVLLESELYQTVNSVSMYFDVGNKIIIKLTRSVYDRQSMQAIHAPRTLTVVVCCIPEHINLNAMLHCFHLELLRAVGEPSERNTIKAYCEHRMLQLADDHYQTMVQQALRV